MSWRYLRGRICFVQAISCASDPDGRHDWVEELGFHGAEGGDVVGGATGAATNEPKGCLSRLRCTLATVACRKKRGPATR